MGDLERKVGVKLTKEKQNLFIFTIE